MLRILVFLLAVTACVSAMGQVTQGVRIIEDFRLVGGVPEVRLAGGSKNYVTLQSLNDDAEFVNAPLMFLIADYRGTGADLEVNIGKGSAWVKWSELKDYTQLPAGGGGGGATNLSIGPRTTTTVEIKSSTGLDAVIPAPVPDTGQGAGDGTAGLLDANTARILANYVHPSSGSATFPATSTQEGQIFFYTGTLASGPGWYKAINLVGSWSAL